MNHDEIRELLHAYGDGELDLVSSREVEHHLRDCNDCQQVHQQFVALRDVLTNSHPTYRAPARLRRNIRTALRREARSDQKQIAFWPSLAVGAAFAALVLGFVLFQTLRGSHENAIVDQVVANHVRSLLATHLVDVASSDQHTVKPWFDGKIDFAPDVRDFSMSGFPLVGGRLDYLDGKTAVALVYQRNKHPINIFILPAPGENAVSPAASTYRGYHIISWTGREMKHWAVSDLNETELRQLVSLLQR